MGRNEFLLALADLLEKANATIGGCGCCESPWLDMNGKPILEGDRLIDRRKLRKYVAENPEKRN